MCTSLFRFSHIFYKLVRTHFFMASKNLFGKAINVYIWAFCSLIVMGYIMQQFGLAHDYGCFQLATVIGTIGLFEVYGNAFRSMIDFEGDKHVDYLMTLPLTPAVVLASFVASYTLVGLILSVFMVPFGKLLLWNSFSLENVSWLKFFTILLLSNIFFGVFTIAVTAYVGALSKMENVWSRFIFPLWFMGGFQFSWASIYSLSPKLSYTFLCNPVLYVMEGVRAALLGQADCLPWGWCCVALFGFTAIGWWYANYKMKRLLDFV